MLGDFYGIMAGSAFAQGSARRDSVPPRQQMPTVRPQNEFYRRPGDNPNVVRATLDNMPVWMSDTSSAVPMPTKGAALDEEIKNW